jgi:hypothetical protein
VQRKSYFFGIRKIAFSRRQEKAILSFTKNRFFSCLEKGIFSVYEKSFLGRHKKASEK